MANKNFNNDTPPAAGERPGHGTSALPDGTRPGSSATAGDPTVGGAPPPKNTPATQEIFQVTLRHKSPYPLYRRAGLLLTTQWKPYTVTAEQRAALQADSWVEFQGDSGPGTP